jgi:Putative restriction endonuclease
MARAAKQPVVEAHAPDPTFYPVEEKVGEDSLQRFVVELLRPLVERYLQAAGKPTFVGADQFVYYERHHPGKVVSPDVYVLPGVKPGRRVKNWKVWETGVVPSFALEVVASVDAEKDYREAPGRYAELGVDELIVFDADFQRDPDRVRWQRYRKLAKRGFVRVESTNANRIRSRVLGCFLRVVGEGEEARVRLATGRSGDEIFPTEAEAERAAREVERAGREVERAGRDAERAAKEEALREVARLKALLAKGGGGRSRS